MRLKAKLIKITLILFALILIGVFFIFLTDFSAGKKPVWGVTFSDSYALDLQLDWQKTYLAILDDLQVKNVRISAYWDEVEVEKDNYNFDRVDWQLEEASKRNVNIILSIGRRLPRWPECHDPAWVKHLTPPQANQEVLDVLRTLVERYRDHRSIVAWQVENEPLFAWFGFCPPPDADFLKQEVAFVKSLDSTRPVIITDSGELSNWQQAAGVGDVLGTTLYRIVWNKSLGFFDYWFVPSAVYYWKSEFTKHMHPNLQRIIITEMQMEPWTMNKHMTELTYEEQRQSFNLQRFKSNIRYAQMTGFPEIYLWGAEYWYWLKENGHPEIWQEAQKIWQ